jgi:hypothetical protein
MQVMVARNVTGEQVFAHIVDAGLFTVRQSHQYFESR